MGPSGYYLKPLVLDYLVSSKPIWSQLEKYSDLDPTKLSGASWTHLAVGLKVFGLVSEFEISGVRSFNGRRRGGWAEGGQLRWAADRQMENEWRKWAGSG